MCPPIMRLFDGHSGAWRVARGANSKYYNSTRYSLQTAFPAVQPRPLIPHSASMCVRTLCTASILVMLVSVSTHYGGVLMEWRRRAAPL